MKLPRLVATVILAVGKSDVYLLELPFNALATLTDACGLSSEALIAWADTGGLLVGFPRPNDPEHSAV